MKYNMNKKACCIIGHKIFCDENTYRQILKSEIKELIKYGYTKFITYYISSINSDAIRIIKEIEKQMGIHLFIELIFISSSSVKKLKAAKRKELNELLPLCDKTATISEIKNKAAMNSFYDYLTAECNFVLCLEEDFRFENGRTNKRILNAFMQKGRSYQVYGLQKDG